MCVFLTFEYHGTLGTGSTNRQRDQRLDFILQGSVIPFPIGFRYRQVAILL
jgi:hypothetical protein